MTEPYDPDNPGYYDPNENFDVTSVLDDPYDFELEEDLFSDDVEFEGFTEDDFK